MGKNANLLSELIGASGNEYATIVDEGVPTADIVNYVDSGSYILNAMASGSIFKGFPSNKICAFAGPEASGKSFYVLGITKAFLDKFKNGVVLYFDSEHAMTKEIMEKRGVDTSRVSILPVDTIENFSTQSTKMLNLYMEKDLDKRPPMMMVLDSLGNLSSTAEIANISEGSGKVNMQQAKLIKAAFRVLTFKLGMAGVPLFLTNHVYTEMSGSMYPQDIMSGGSGLKYAANSVIYLSKSQQKDASTNEVVGVRIRCRNIKSRITKEKRAVETLLSFDKGLDRYYGLVDIALKYEIFTKDGTRIKVADGSKHFESKIYKEPETFFTPEVLKKIDEACQQEFLLGQGSSSDLEIDEPLEK